MNKISGGIIDLVSQFGHFSEKPALEHFGMAAAVRVAGGIRV